MSTRAPIRVLIVDDEDVAREHLRALLARHPDMVIAGECRGGREAVATLTEKRIDLVFLDVQMADLDGFGVVAAVGAERMPPVIFVSGYSEFAVRAFEAYALDYLLKPIDRARFDKALDRARQEIGPQHHESHDARIEGLLDHVTHEPATSYPESIAIKTGTQYVITRVEDIEWIEADGAYSKIYVQKRPRLLTKSIGTLEKEVLDPSIFVRVHRSAIVNARKIAAVEPLFHGELSLILKDGSRVQCSRRFRKRLDGRVYFTA